MTGTALGRLIDNVGALVVRQALTWSLTFVLILYLPRYLGDAGFGMVTFATALLPLLLIATNLGVGTLLVKRIAVDPDSWSEYFWSAIALRLFGTALVLAVMLPAVLLASGGEMQTLLLLTAATLVVMSLVKTQEFVIQGLEKMRWLAFAEIANKALVAALGIALLLAGHGVVAFGAVVLLGASAQLLMNVPPLLRLGLRRPRFSYGRARILLIGGLPFLFAGAITNLYTLTDVAMLQALVPQEVVGWYGAAFQLYNTLNFFPLILSTAMLPLMSRMYAERHPQFLPTASRATGFALMLALPIGVGLAVSSHALIDLLGYPDPFDNSTPVLIILGLMLIPSGQLMILYMVVTAMDRQAAWVPIITIALAAGLVLNAALIPVFQHVTGNGGIGAALASLIAECFQLILALRLVPDGLLTRALGAQAARATAAALAMGVAVVALQVLFHAPIFVFIPVGAAVYGSGLLATGAVSIPELRRLTRDWADSRSTAGMEPASR